MIYATDYSNSPLKYNDKLRAMSLSRMNKIPAINMPTIRSITNRLVD